MFNVVRKLPILRRGKFFGNSVLQKIETVIHNQSAPASRGLQLFYVCKEQTESDKWHKEANIASNFHGKHGILMIHIWMVNKRLMLLPETTARAEVQETLFDTLWSDTMARIRATGVAEISVNARLKDVQSWSLPTCLELDYAFSLLDPEVKAKAGEAKEKSKLTNNEEMLSLALPEETSDADLVIDHIAGTLWRQLYQRDEITSDMLEKALSDGVEGDAAAATSTTTAATTATATTNRIQTSEDVVTDLASYIYHEYQSLEYDITDNEFSNGLFRFGQVPEKFGTCSSDNSSDNGLKYDIRSSRSVPNATDRWVINGSNAPNLWKPIMHVDGKIYYWNTDTFDSTWEIPVSTNDN